MEKFADKLQDIAQGVYYNERVLREALVKYQLDDDEKAIINGHLTGKSGQDPTEYRMRLQDIAIKIRSGKMPEFETLTKENASRASTIISKQNPEWGTKRFNYNEQPLNDGKSASTFGTGVNSAVLFESEYHFWNVATWR